LAQSISETLNAAWDPAWNVFVFELVGDSTPDAVVVGYAFRDHWMWFNGYAYQGRTFSFIIWKDYNCVTWISAADSAVNGNFGASQFDADVINALNYLTIVSPYDDIWSFGSSVLNQLQTSISTSAFAVIIFQKPINTANSIIGAARFCATASDNYSAASINQQDTNKNVGVFLFRTRIGAGP
jgi:hypothetical protein